MVKYFITVLMSLVCTSSYSQSFFDFDDNVFFYEDVNETNVDEMDALSDSYEIGIATIDGPLEDIIKLERNSVGFFPSAVEIRVVCLKTIPPRGRMMIISPYIYIDIVNTFLAKYAEGLKYVVEVM